MRQTQQGVELRDVPSWLTFGEETGDSECVRNANLEEWHMVENTGQSAQLRSGDVFWQTNPTASRKASVLGLTRACHCQ